jgi:hypothetical protein
MNCIVKMIWDSETERWHSETDDNLCITLESDSFDELAKRVCIAVPEMLELNSGYKGPIRLFFEVERVETVNVTELEEAS